MSSGKDSTAMEPLASSRFGKTLFIVLLVYFLNILSWQPAYILIENLSVLRGIYTIKSLQNTLER